MADEPVTPPVVPQGNEPAARTETGEIKNQQATQPITTPQAKTEAETKPSTEVKPETKVEPGVVPDKYELKAPEGYEIDAKVLADAEPVFKELGLTNDGAQKLTDLWSKHSLEAAEAPYKAYEAMRDGWRSDIIKAPDLGDGTEGFKSEVRKNIDTAISAIGDAKAISEFKAALDLTGAGDNPALARGLNAIGKLLSEGTAVRAGAPAPVKSPTAGPRNAAQALFPNLPSSANP